MLMIERPIDKEKIKGFSAKKYQLIITNNGISEISETIPQEKPLNNDELKKYPKVIREAINGLNYINKRMKRDNQDRKV